MEQRLADGEETKYFMEVKVGSLAVPSHIGRLFQLKGPQELYYVASRREGAHGEEYGLFTLTAGAQMIP